VIPTNSGVAIVEQGEVHTGTTEVPRGVTDTGITIALPEPTDPEIVTPRPLPTDPETPTGQPEPSDPGISIALPDPASPETASTPRNEASTGITIIQNIYQTSPHLTQNYVPKKYLSCMKGTVDFASLVEIEKTLKNVNVACPFKSKKDGKYRALISTNTGARIYFESDNDIGSPDFTNDFYANAGRFAEIMQRDDTDLIFEYNCTLPIKLQKAWFPSG
jgi:hypothetical protein